MGKVFFKVVDAYESEGIPIWGFTVESELAVIAGKVCFIHLMKWSTLLKIT